MPLFDLVFALFFFVLGLVAAIVGIPVFITGIRSKADFTVFIGAVCIAVSVTCFIFLSQYEWHE